MKKLISSLIAIMMVLTMIPYTAFAETAPEDGSAVPDASVGAEFVTEDITIGHPEEITVYYFENKDVTVESENTSIAYGMVTNSSMIISSGTVLYGKTIKITPSQIGTANLIIRANGEVDKIYTINVQPIAPEENVHIGSSSEFEFVSLYDEVISFHETEGVTMNVLSKTQRTSTMIVNGVTVSEVNFVYKIQVDYDEPGEYTYTISGEKTGEAYKISAVVAEHEWEAEPQTDREATCTEDGQASVHCTECDAVKDETSIPVLEHTYDWVIDVPATEDAPGIMHEECIVCGAVANEDTVIEQLTHTHELVKTEAVEAGCLTAGNIEYYSCVTCGSMFADEETLEPLTQEEVIIAPHDHSLVVRPAVEATCETEGVTEEIYCSICEQVLVPQKIVLAKGHRYSNSWMMDDTGHWHECECGLKADESRHEFEWIIDKPATETESGIKHEECITCHAKKSENTNIDKLMHISDLVKIEAVPATCTTSGNIEYYYCRSCDNFYANEAMQHLIKKEDTVVKAKGHNYSEWQTISKSTCVRKGYEFTSCKDCGIAEIRELPLKTHKMEYLTKVPTCTEPGAEITYCTICNMEISERIPATGHVAVPVEIAPTCTEDGWTGGSKCAICEVVLEQPLVIPAMTHKYGEWIIEKVPTCTGPGAEYRVCSTCKNIENAVIARLDHEVEVVPAVAATCTATGLTEGIYCTSCNNVLKEQEPVAQMAHRWKTDMTVDRKATISNGGSMSYHCSDCNAINKASTVKIYMIKKTTVNSLVYNGSARTPVVTVVDNAGRQLQKGTDFIVTFKNAAGTRTVEPKNVGTYKAVVNFKGKYSGSVTKAFKINPKATTINNLTKGKGRFTVKWNKRTEQVTGYQIKYSGKSNMSNAKYIMIKTNKTVSKTVKNLKSKKKYWVQVRTFKTVNGTKYWSAWSGKWYVTTK